jgi:hypothetical protein
LESTDRAYQVEELRGLLFNFNTDMLRKGLRRLVNG